MNANGQAKSAPQSGAPSFAARMIKINGAGKAASTAQTELQQIIENAQRQAETIMAAAHAKSEELSQRAYAEARMQAQQEMAREILETRWRLHAEIVQMRPVLAQIVRMACEKLIGERFGLARVERCLEEGLRAHAGMGLAILKVSPRDRAGAAAIVNKLNAESPSFDLRLVEDPSLRSGASLLEAAGLTVELGLQRQLDLLQDLLAQTGSSGQSPHLQDDEPHVAASYAANSHAANSHE